jgi:hypothetical protein
MLNTGGINLSNGNSTVCPSTIALCTNSITKNNQSFVGQARYGLSSWVNLVGEYTHTRSESQGDVVGTSNSFALGSIAFF